MRCDRSAVRGGAPNEFMASYAMTSYALGSGQENMNILSFNPGHDGAIAYLKDAHLIVSIEAEKNSNYRYSPISGTDLLMALGAVDDVPDVICVGGWWARDHDEFLRASSKHVGYRGVSVSDTILDDRFLFGFPIRYFSSSHERSHILCSFGMSPLPKGTPCYALIWEGAIGAFYEIDDKLSITRLADVLPQPGNRYALLYGLADPTFHKDAHPRLEDAGKLMALASFSQRSPPSAEDRKLISLLLNGPYQTLSSYEGLSKLPYLNVGLDDPAFRNMAGIFSDELFGMFYRYAEANMKKGMPLVIAGGCGLNCDWNTKWRESGLFSNVFVPPVANDSGSAIGTAIDAQFHFTGDPKIEWSVYAGLPFVPTGSVDTSLFDVCDSDYEVIADALANDLILAWVSGKYEIGPRALGNRSILAAPFLDSTRARLNEIKGREQFRPIAPVCMEEEAYRCFSCEGPSPFMLYTHSVKADVLGAVTHVNGTARIQTVARHSNENLYNLLLAFKARTGYGVLCNTSLNFRGKGFINNLGDLSAYTLQHELDGFVVDGLSYFRRSSKWYQRYCRDANRKGLHVRKS